MASSGKTSLAYAMIAAAQSRDEEVALVDPQGIFFGPSARGAGVDLDRLLVVRPPGEPALASAGGLRVVDHLLRSQGFPVVVLDLSGMTVRPPLDRLFRVARLAHVAETALIILTETEPERSSLGSPVSLRLAVRRTGFRFLPEATPPFILGGARLEIEIRKSKFGPPGGRVVLTILPEPALT